MQDYYQILEVHPDASPEVIDKAYRTLVMKYHPDRYHISDKSKLEERMKSLNKAYETLSNPKLRVSYHQKFESYQQQLQGSKQSQLWANRFRNIGYWFLLTIFLAFTGKAILKLISMLPILPKLVLIFALAWGLRTLFRKLKLGKGV